MTGGYQLESVARLWPSKHQVACKAFSVPRLVTDRRVHQSHQMQKRDGTGSSVRPEFIAMPVSSSAGHTVSTIYRKPLYPHPSLRGLKKTAQEGKRFLSFDSLLSESQHGKKLEEPTVTYRQKVLSRTQAEHLWQAALSPHLVSITCFLRTKQGIFQIIIKQSG